MKYFIIFSLIVLLSAGALAQDDHFQDVPREYWAAEAVNDLVKMGVTKGYPDGTFRGKRDISRYEVAAFLSKFAKYFNQREGRNEKLIEELKAETALIKYGINKAAEETQFSGELLSSVRTLLSLPRGTKIDYRLKLNLTKKFDESSSLKIGLDTVDAGFNTDTDRPLATRLIDIESKFKLGGLNYKINLGPGVVVHTENSKRFVSENNTIYVRPKSALKVYDSIGKLEYSASYVTRQVETSGKIGVHELTGKMKYKYGNLALSFQPRYLFIINGPKDVLAEVGLNYMLNKNWITYILLGIGDFQAAERGMYLKVEEKIIDPWDTGTTIVVRFDAVGSRYRNDVVDEYEFIYLNNFNRLILDGTIDIGLKVKQRLLNKLSLEWKGDYVATDSFEYGEAYPETYFLWQLSLLYDLSSRIGLNAFYKSYNVPSGIAQFSDPVPEVSEILGIGVNCAF